MRSRYAKLAIAAALAFATPAFAQTGAPPTPGVPGGAGSATPGTVNPEATDPGTRTPSTVSPPGNVSPPPTGAVSLPRTTTRMAAAGTVSAGMPVQTPAGEALGTVRDIVPNASGDPGYVLITTPTGRKTAVPYSTVQSVTRNGSIVLARARLEGAPQVTDSQLLNSSDTRWQKQADRYWNGRDSLQPAQPGGGKANSPTPDHPPS
jgi:hypothetical protein